MTVAYLAGPMRGIRNFNVDSFDSAAEWLREEAGYGVINPCDEDRKRHGDDVFKSETGDLADIAHLGFDLGHALSWDLHQIATKADGVVLLPGWENSAGARAEKACAEALGKKVEYLRRLPSGSWTLWHHTAPPPSSPVWTPDEFVDYLSDATLWDAGFGDDDIDVDTLRETGRAFAQKVSDLIGETATRLYDQPSPLGNLSQTIVNQIIDHRYGPDRLADAVTGEVRTVSSTGGEKGVKPERFDLLPTDALALIARHFGVGASKYADHNWRKGYEWSKNYAALQRHLNAYWGGEDVDAETGSLHLAAAGFHVLALLTYATDPFYAQFDDRYKTGR